jgi:hypothetical protein
MTVGAPPPDGEEPAALEGRPRVIRFPPHWHAWFARQSDQRLAILDELVDERIERRVLRDWLARLRHAAAVAFVAAATAAHWFADQLAWLVERLPVLRHLWRLVTGDL